MGEIGCFRRRCIAGYAAFGSAAWAADQQVDQGLHGRVGCRQRRLGRGIGKQHPQARVEQVAAVGDAAPPIGLTAAGAVAGERADSIVWFDQHGDLNTPETSTYGFLDGMALAVVLGQCWGPMARTIPGFRPVEPQNCLLADARDLDPDELELLQRLPVTRASCADAPEKAGRLGAAGIVRTHLHVDLDVHDPGALRVNRYARPGGPDPDQLRQAVCGVAASVPVAGLTLTAYDPAFDPGSRVPPVACRLLVDVLAALEKSRC